MTRFNPENKKELTYDETCGPAMLITDQADADQYLAAYAEYIDNRVSNAIPAIEVARMNLGYFAGYYDDRTQKRVNKLFKTEHPMEKGFAE